MRKFTNLAVLLCGLAALPVLGQEDFQPPVTAYQPLSYQQLDQLLGPIALYPDPLLGEVLRAATLPAQVVLADRYITDGGDPNQVGQQPWDSSVQALAHYPSVLKWMDDNLGWTAEVGQAFLNQPQDVMDSIQRLRTTAQNYGNLQSTPQQQVVVDGGIIEILPVNPEVIYVPLYQPATVFYQQAYGNPFITFSIGFPIGIWLDCDFDWQNHNVRVWSHDHPRPPNWWHERPTQRAASIGRQTWVWRPGNARSAGVVNGGDRGWNNQAARHVVTAVGRPEARSMQPRNASAFNQPRTAAVPRLVAIPDRPAPAFGNETAAASRSASNGAFIGIQSSQDTRQYSERGRQSRETANPSAPVSRPATHANNFAGNQHNGSQPKR